jgi:hypothetical protein
MEPRADFSPFSPDEVVAVLDDLAATVERNPAVLTNPAFVGFVRLAVTASTSARARPAPPVPEEVVVAPPPPVAAPASVAPAAVASLDEKVAEVVRLIRSRGLREGFLLRDLRGALDEASPPPKPAVVQQLEADLGRVQRQLQSAQEEARASREAATKALQEAKREVASLREEVDARVTEEARKRRLAEEESARARLELEEAKKATRSVAKEALLRTLRTIEWSSKSTQYTVRSTGKPCACCPSCQGLDPTGIAASKSVGHQKGCIIAKLLLEATTSS